MGLLDAGSPKDTAISWTFVVVQLALLAAVVLLPAGDAWVLGPWSATMARILQLVGIAVLVAGLVNLGRSLTALAHPVPHGVLKTNGLYRLVRHPIYSGIIALVVGSSASSGSVAKVLAAGALIGWFSIKARWEETRLRATYPAYGDYAAHTPRFVPFWPTRPG
jgi:protein-S-isoprenylcysteine O-methyltransferase Ste14